MSAQPKEAAKEILAGEPQEAARSWLGWTALAMFVLFGIDTVLVLDGFWLPIDVRITTFVQGLTWGPIVYPMELINVTAGYWQVLAGIIAIVALFVVERRAGWLMLIEPARQHHQAARLAPEADCRPGPHPDPGQRLQLPERACRLLHLDELHARGVPGAANQAGLPTRHLAGGDHRDRADVHRAGLGR